MTDKKITRKDFLKSTGAGLGSLLLQGALPSAPRAHGAYGLNAS
jgi:hypothetical protein